MLATTGVAPHDAGAQGLPTSTWPYTKRVRGGCGGVGGGSYGLPFIIQIVFPANGTACFCV